MPTTRAGPRRALRPPADEHTRFGRRELLVAVPLVVLLAVGVPAGYDRLTAPAPLPPPVVAQTRWRYEMHLVVPLPAGSPQRDDVLSTVTLVEDGLRPALAAAGGRLDTDDEGAKAFTIVMVGNDEAVLQRVLAERGRPLPGGTQLLVYGWTPDGAAGSPLNQRLLADVPTALRR